MPKVTEPQPKLTAKAPARMSKRDPLTREQLTLIDGWWRAANYLAACQLYLLDNPLLRQPLKPEHLKEDIVGHWGTCPGQNFIYTHLNRAIVKYDLNMIYLSGPGHGGSAMVAQDYLDGSYSEIYPNISQDAEGMKRLFKQFSFPGGIPTHVARKLRAPSMRGASWATPWPTPLARSWTTLISSPPAWWETVRQRPPVWPPRGTPTNFSTPSATVRCCPFSI